MKTFRLPAGMTGKRLFVSFRGAESGLAVWLNGKYIGFSGDSFTPHEFELTDALADGENKLACRVYRWCAGSWLEDQDFLRFSGLYREVYLYAVVPGFGVEGMATEVDGLDAAGTVEGGGRIDLLGVGVVLVVGNG